MIKAYTFDLEGTLVNLEDIHTSNWIEVCRDHGQETTLEGILEKMPHFIGAGDPEVANEFGNWLKAEPETLLRDKDRKYQQALKTAKIELRPGAAEFLDSVKAQNLPMAIGSLTRDKFAWNIIESANLKKYFLEERIVLASHVEHLKPAPDVYIETAKRLSVSPTEQLVFEDSARGVKAATAAGSPVIALPIYIDLTKDALIASGATQIFESWEEVNTNLPLSS